MFRLCVFCVFLLFLSTAWSRTANNAKVHNILRVRDECENNGGQCADTTTNKCIDPNTGQNAEWVKRMCMSGGKTVLCCPQGYNLQELQPDDLTPCGSAAFGEATSLRDRLMFSARTLYDLHHTDGIYTQKAARWEGVKDRMCPPDAPQRSDCSSSVSWIYWTVFGNGPDFINAASWTGGYTGTLSSHGTTVDCDASTLNPGDLCFYGTPIGHVNMFMGGDDPNAQCIDHGRAPVRYVPMGNPVLCKSYIP